MIPQLGWSVAVQMATWVQEAVAAARNKREQRMAHVVANAGILVAGLRHIDRVAYKLFVPLQYFQPAGWDQVKVAEWTSNLFRLAYEDDVMPRMRSALSATRSLIAEQDDPHLQALLGRTAEIADKTCESALDPLMDVERPRLSNWWDQGPLSEPLQQGVLPNLIALLEEPDANSQKIREIARDFIDGQAKLLRSLADEMETEFGRIIAIQQQDYPTLAAPTWVWETA